MTKTEESIQLSLFNQISDAPTSDTEEQILEEITEDMPENGQVIDEMPNIELTAIDDKKVEDIDISSVYKIIFAENSNTHRMLDSIDDVDMSVFLRQPSHVQETRAYSFFENFIKFAGYINFFKSGNRFSGREDEILDAYHIKGLFAPYYKPTYLVEEFESLPVINMCDAETKYDNLIYMFTNYLFKYFDKKVEDDYIKIVIPEWFTEKVNSFLSLFNHRHDFEEKIPTDTYGLYYLIEPFLAKDDFESQTLSHFFRRQFEEFVARRKMFITDNTLHISKKAFTYFYSGSGFGSRYSGIFDELNKLYNMFVLFYLCYDVNDFFIAKINEKTLSKNEHFTNKIIQIKRRFAAALSQRLVPVDELTHKAAVKEAKNLGMTHFFVPVTNNIRLFNSEVPVAIYHTVNGFEILPPSASQIEQEPIYDIDDYYGFYGDADDVGTKKTPHIIGKTTLFDASINEALFLQILLEEYNDIEIYDTIVNTYKVIEKYALVKTRLVKLLQAKQSAKQIDINTLIDEMLYSDLQDTSRLDIKELPINPLTNRKFERNDIVKYKDDYYNIISINVSYTDADLQNIFNLENLMTDEQIFVGADAIDYSSYDMDDYLKYYDYLVSEKALSYITKASCAVLFYLDKIYYYWENKMILLENIDDAIDMKTQAENKLIELVVNGTISLFEASAFVVPFYYAGSSGFNLKDGFADIVDIDNRKDFVILRDGVVK